MRVHHSLGKSLSVHAGDCHEVNDPLPKMDPRIENGKMDLLYRSPIAVKYPPMMPTLKTQISKFDGTVTEQEEVYMTIFKCTCS